MYPMMEYGVELLAYTSLAGREAYCATNADGDEYHLSRRVYREILNADGTHELNLSAKMTRRIEECGLVRTKRIVDEGGDKYIILLPIGRRRGRKLKPLASCLYKLHRLMLAVLPLLAFIMSMRTDPVIIPVNYGLVIILVIVSVTLHELGHMISALCFGAEVRSMGILLLYGFLPLGAYVDYDDEDLSDREKMKALAAGIQANLILACVFLVGRFFLPALSSTLLLAVIGNAVTVLENLLPHKGSDGEKILNVIFGVEDVTEFAERVACSRKLRARIRRRGLPGRISLFILFVVRSSKWAFLALIFFSNGLWFWLALR